MTQFILTNILMLSLGAILYLVARSLPKISDEDESVLSKRTGFFERWVTSEIPEKADAILNSFLVKFLRKVKVFLLKIDNLLGKRLEKIGSKNEKNGKNGGSGSTFKDLGKKE